MEILVFVKRVAAFGEEEVRILNDGKDIDLSKAPFRMNDWDTYAVEEATRIVEKFGGSLTAISIGDEEADEVLRRAIATGAQRGILIKEKNLIDPFKRASIAKNLIDKERLSFDLILTGLQAEDDQFSSFGGILAGLLKIPFASAVVGIEEIERDYLIVRREIEGGVNERVKISLPCLLSVQTGINEPRYVSIMGIRKASKIERKVIDGASLLESYEEKIELRRFSYPERREGAKLLEGNLDEICAKLLSILKEKGVL